MSRRGVTLFEAVAAMAIVGIVSIAALEAAGSQMRTATLAREKLEAAALAQQRMDWLEFLDENRLRALPDSVREGTFAEPFEAYTWETTAEPVSTQPGVYDVWVHVRWPENEFSLHTYAYRRPIIAVNSGAAR